MKLYRGYQQKPDIVGVPTRKRYDVLSSLQRGYGNNLQSREGMLPEYQKQFEPYIQELDMLTRAVQERLRFTNNGVAARDAAGQDGFLVVLDVTEAEAFMHIKPDQEVTLSTGEVLKVQQFEFTGLEVGRRFDKEGKAELIDIRREREEGAPPGEDRRRLP